MNDTVFNMYVDLKKLINKAQKSEIKGAEHREMVQEWMLSTEVFERTCPDYLPKYERLVNNQESFTPEQIDFICYQIGNWYVEWKERLVIDLKKGTHRLGYAKEQLKTMICGD
ncbi:hypothetical protein UFOVP685_42 [uncultured Caudovirales phage]|uniref:Uncharacterized protein n=1 Tax=uncultured Caudovirales phage TaxID=2100421 RepID=A0A6J5N1D5_9CAUD|nr:hypothetical protein UFOVP590_42 [uncultured Caudovirales phage]CAB4157701.1 hypothetical protein UFOVP685_42 [uncultured Caudovirales phage]CAB5225314.1 hypothetical protein UFOVP750_10 [uncultured Caudovirales phage]